MTYALAYLGIIIAGWYAARSWAAYIHNKKQRARKVAQDVARWERSLEQRRELGR